MQRRLLEFIGRLRKAKHFDDAAMTALREMLAVAQATLEESRFAKRGRILRGMAHLRPADGYQRLVVLDDTPSRDATGAIHLPSASAFRWVKKHQCAVAIDVSLGQVTLQRDEGASVIAAPGPTDGGFNNQESVLRLRGREVTHLYAAPLRTRRGAIEGMISIEAECQTAAGKEFIFATAGEELQLLADIAEPYLASLPLRPSAAVTTDELLPVVGVTMAGLVAMLRVFAQQEETILMGGPTGAGKSRLARWCHERSARRGHAFELLDLLTIPEDLQMAELFGWRKGAFSGATRDTPGAVGRAHKGTLFLDEIDKLSLKAQAGLLHLLEERTYRALGERGGEQRADVRFIVGTNADLYALVQSGQFREDLYYRINVLPIKIPPLADRRDEVPLWAGYMANRRHREAVPDGEARISSTAERLLCEHEWPGNLRQLDNVVRRAYALALMTSGDAAREIVLEERHFLRALSYERGTVRRSVMDSLRGAATAFTEEAERLSERGDTLDLDLCDAFRGVVLATAVQRLGSKEAAFQLFGRAAQVQSRNHHKLLRRELEKVDALVRALGDPTGAPFASLLEEDDPAGGDR